MADDYKPTAAERADQLAARLSSGDLGISDSPYFRPIVFIISGLGAAVLHAAISSGSMPEAVLTILYVWAALSTFIGATAVAVVMGTKGLRQ